MQSQTELYENLERQYDDVRIQLQSIKQDLNAYEKAIFILKDHMTENLNFSKTLSDRNQIAIVQESYDKLQAKHEQFTAAKTSREDEYKRQLAHKIQLENHVNSMKTQLVSIKKLQEAQEDQSKDQGIEPRFSYDVETVNILDEHNWNLGDGCNRGLAETLLNRFPSGTFLIRSSRTQSNCYVLSVTANSKIQHCLIDKINDEYCFRPYNPQRKTYSSLMGLVMEYRHKSLIDHNPELDTALIYPVLSQVNKYKPESLRGPR